MYTILGGLSQKEGHEEESKVNKAAFITGEWAPKSFRCCSWNGAKIRQMLCNEYKELCNINICNFSSLSLILQQLSRKLLSESGAKNIKFICSIIHPVHVWLWINVIFSALSPYTLWFPWCAYDCQSLLNKFRTEPLSPCIISFQVSCNPCQSPGSFHSLCLKIPIYIWILGQFCHEWVPNKM